MSRGDKIRAAVVLLEGLRRRPHLIPEHLPLALTTFAQAVHGAGLERELLDVLEHCPQPDIALAELYAALNDLGKERAVSAIERARRRHRTLGHVDVPRLHERVAPRFIARPDVDGELEELPGEAPREASDGAAEATVEEEGSDGASSGSSAEAEMEDLSEHVEILEEDAEDEDDALAYETVGVVASAPRSQSAQGGVGRGARRGRAPGGRSDAVDHRAPRPARARDARDHPSRQRGPLPELVQQEERSSVWAQRAPLSEDDGHRGPQLNLHTHAGPVREPRGRSRAKRSVRARPYVPPEVEALRVREETGRPPHRRGGLQLNERSVSNGAGGGRSRARRMPTLSSAGSVDDLLSQAAAAAEAEMRGDEVLPVQAGADGGDPGAPIRRERGRTWKRAFVGLLLLAITIAVITIVHGRLDEADLQGRLSAAASLAETCDLSGLSEARSQSLDVLDEWPSSGRAYAQAFLFDRLLATRYDDQKARLQAGAAGDAATREPAFRVGLVIEALHGGDVDAAREVHEATPVEVWEREPGLEDWSTGLILASEAQPREAARALARAVDRHAIPLLPLLDLGELALRSRTPEVVSLFVQRAQPRRGEHPFLELAPALLAGDLLTPPSERIRELLISTPATSLTRNQQVWYWLALAQSELHAERLEDAARAAREGLALEGSHPDLLLVSALIFTAQDRLDDALQGYRVALDRMAQSGRRGPGHRLVHSVLREAGRPDLVVRTLLPAEADFSALDPADQLRVADALLAQGEVTRAAELIDAHLEAGGARSPSLLAHRVDAARILGEDAIREALREELEKTSDAGLRAQRRALRKQIDEGTFTEAREMASRLSTTHPDVWELLRVRLELMAAGGDGEDAALLLGHWAEGHPMRSRRDIFGGLVLSRAGSLPQERAALLATLDTTDLELLEAQAELAWRAGLLEEAEERLEAISAAGVPSAQASAVRGMMLRDAGEHRDAISHLKDGQRGHLTMPGLYFALAHAYRESSESQRAIKALERALARPSERIEAVNRLGTLFFETGLHTKGRRYFDEHLLHISDSPANRAYRGHIHLWMAILADPTDPESRASRYLKRARTDLGDDTRVLYHLGAVEQAHGRTTRARELYEAALTADPENAAARQALEALGGSPTSGDASEPSAPRDSQRASRDTGERPSTPSPASGSASEAPEKLNRKGLPAKKAEASSSSSSSSSASTKKKSSSRSSRARKRRREKRRAERRRKKKREAARALNAKEAKALSDIATEKVGTVIVKPLSAGAVELARTVFGVR